MILLYKIVFLAISVAFSANISAMNFLKSLMGSEREVEKQQHAHPECLFCCAQRGDLMGVDAAARKTYIDTPDGRGLTALCYAIMAGHVELVSYMRSLGASRAVLSKHPALLAVLKTREYRAMRKAIEETIDLAPSEYRDQLVRAPSIQEKQTPAPSEKKE